VNLRGRFDDAANVEGGFDTVSDIAAVKVCSPTKCLGKEVAQGAGMFAATRGAIHSADCTQDLLIRPRV
jgi:hypothetical protein